MSVSYLVGPYIKEEYHDNIRNYVYRGADHSIFMKYITGPFSQWLVNNVTVSGFFLQLIYNAILFYYNGFYIQKSYPGWTCFVAALFYFSYYILDICDGKQARKTHSSSALGMLVDHGTDATTTFWVSIGSGTILYASEIWEYSLFWFTISLTFFLATWENYITGELILPIVHGVSEGTIIIVAADFISGIKGDYFWSLTYEIFGYNLKVRQIVFIFTAIAGFGYSIASLIKVLAYQTKKVILDGLVDTLIIFFFYGSYFCLCFLDNTEYLKDKPKAIVLMYGFWFAKIMTMMQLAHLTESRYNPYTIGTMVPVITLLAHSLIYHFTGIEVLVTVDYLVYFFLAWNVIGWLHFCWFVSEEMCEILNIKRFSLGPRHVKEIKSE